MIYKIWHSVKPNNTKSPSPTTYYYQKANKWSIIQQLEENMYPVSNHHCHGAKLIISTNLSKSSVHQRENLQASATVQQLIHDLHNLAFNQTKQHKIFITNYIVLSKIKRSNTISAIRFQS